MGNLAVTPKVLTNSLQFQGGIPAQFLQGTGTRVNATAGSSASAAAAIPTGGSALIVSCTDNIWLNFGDNTVAAAANATSILFPAGVAPYVPKVGETHFSVLRVGSSDVPVQIESAGTTS